MAEVARVVACLRRPWAALVVRVLAATGARIGEVAGLRWRDVDLVEQVLHIPAEGKTGARDVPLGRWVVADLRRAQGEAGPDDLVFGASARTIRGHLPGLLAAACEEAGVAHFSPHCLRRAAVDAYARARVDPASAAASLGHSIDTMLRLYREVGLDDQRAAVELVRLGEIPAEGSVIDLEAERASRRA